MKKVIGSIISLLFIGNLIAQTNNIPSHLQDISVTIRSDEGSGSGVIFTRKDANNETVNFIWTAAHVVADLKTERKVTTQDGSQKTIVEFKDAKVIKEIIEDGRKIGSLQLIAQIIRYSDADTGEDLALLKIRKKSFTDTSVVFYTNSEIPALGTELYHVGSLLGEMGANSLTSGIYSQIGRVFNNIVFDQTSVTAFPGSSGGGVFLKNDGRYVGMLVRLAGETFNIIVPVRRMLVWSKSAKIEWAMIPEIAMPQEEELKKLPIEDVGQNFNITVKQQKKDDNYVKKQK